MSKKRSQRNTKSFRKSRARAGIPRQDLRSGGRVSLMEGSVTIGQNDDELTTTETTEETTTETPETTEETTPETTVETTPVDTSDDMGSDAAAKAKADAKKALEEADKAREEEAAEQEAIPKDYSLEIADLEAKKKKLEAASKRLEGTGHPGYGEDLADINRQLERFNIRQQEYTNYQASQPEQPPQSYDLRDGISQEAEAELNAAETAIVENFSQNPALQGLSSQYTDILNSGMSLEETQKALQNLSGETQKIVEQLIPEFENVPVAQLSADLERRGLGPLTASKTTGDDRKDDDGGIIHNLVEGFLQMFLSDKLAAVATDLGGDILTWIGGKATQVFDIFTGSFREATDTEIARSNNFNSELEQWLNQGNTNQNTGETNTSANQTDTDSSYSETTQTTDPTSSQTQTGTTQGDNEDDEENQESETVLDKDGIREDRIAGSQGEVFNEEGERDDRRTSRNTTWRHNRDGQKDS